MSCCTKEAGPNAPPEVKKKLKEYYDKCQERYKDKEYCSRVAWQIYCMHVNPEYEGCTEYGKTKGQPYSKPVSKANVTKVVATLIRSGKMEEAIQIISLIPTE